MEAKKVILVIMDGWGLGKVKESDAIQHANVPFVSSFMTNIQIQPWLPVAKQ